MAKRLLLETVGYGLFPVADKMYATEFPIRDELFGNPSKIKLDFRILGVKSHVLKGTMESNPAFATVKVDFVFCSLSQSGRVVNAGMKTPVELRYSKIASNCFRFDKMVNILN